MKITKWHIVGIVVLAIVLGIWFTPIVPSKDSEGNETIDTIPGWLRRRLRPSGG